ncbi:mitochondrial processing peptidase alpha subunit [Catenaria anguillulae PL171]|uniref:Mitochondrial processing peptidase alpha subunit n=1 Tax=Catenaria anguillulae PL171 TaxID=765915 RepID=A0A1Y2HUQ4_9FUNG|nr:mitochondrial processing peptidase alpha subunit [Catenaria anguillulae PL171]
MPPTSTAAAALAAPLRTAASSAASLVTRTTRLPSGLTVATIPTTSHFAAVGVYVDAGPVYETSDDRGASRFVSSLAFKSTQSSSEQDIMQAMAQMGGNLFCTSTRESLIYQGSVLTHEVPRAVKLLADVTLRPAITDAEMDQARATLAFEAEEILAHPAAYLGELLHAVAYGGKGLGNSVVCDPDQARSMDKAVVERYFKRYLHPSRMVIAGAGVQHEWLCELVEKEFVTKVPADSTIAKDPTTPYVGGTHTLAVPPPPPTHTNFEQPLTHMQVAFPVPTFTHPDMFPLSVLQVLMGGGGSFSAGGPGKGMYSRLYTNVLNRYAWMESCVAFQHAYARSNSLFGISASCLPTHNQFLANVLAGELVQMTKEYAGDEVERAKNQLKSSLLMNLESQVITVEDIGRQVLAQGTRVEPLELVDKIERVDKDELVRVATDMVARQPTSVIVGEDVNGVGDFAASLSAFRGGSGQQQQKKRFWR